ncbi:hypothetical protein [Sphingomonas sp. BAUL-RG-20F-R05-02]|nr:hypothetical protein [Sphingomonas sp. BAUL-RG-20F-R05-02]
MNFIPLHCPDMFVPLYWEAFKEHHAIEANRDQGVDAEQASSI